MDGIIVGMLKYGRETVIEWLLKINGLAWKEKRVNYHNMGKAYRLLYINLQRVEMKVVEMNVEIIDI